MIHVYVKGTDAKWPIDATALPRSYGLRASNHLTKAVVCSTPVNARFFRIADLYENRSESQVSAIKHISIGMLSLVDYFSDQKKMNAADVE